MPTGCTVVSIWRAEMRSVLRNAGTGPLNGLLQRVTLQVNPRYAQMIAMIERSRRQLASEEGFEEGVVGEMAGRFHGSTRCSLNRMSIVKVTTVVGSSGFFGVVNLHEECKRPACNPHGFPGNTSIQRAGVRTLSIVIRITSLDRIIEFPGEAGVARFMMIACRHAKNSLARHRRSGRGRHRAIACGR